MPGRWTSPSTARPGTSSGACSRRRSCTRTSATGSSRWSPSRSSAGCSSAGTAHRHGALLFVCCAARRRRDRLAAARPVGRGRQRRRARAHRGLGGARPDRPAPRRGDRVRSAGRRGRGRMRPAHAGSGDSANWLAAVGGGAIGLLLGLPLARLHRAAALGHSRRSWQVLGVRRASTASPLRPTRHDERRPRAAPGSRPPRRRPGGRRRRLEGGGPLRGQRDQQPAGGHRVADQPAARLGHVVVERRERLRPLAVAPRPARRRRRRPRAARARPAIAGTAPASTSAATPLASASSCRWPSRPKPVTSVTRVGAGGARRAADASRVERGHHLDGAASSSASRRARA